MAIWPRFLPALVPAALWLWVFSHVRDEWTLNPQYHYGWAVPFLGALLFSFRWIDRPPAQPAVADSRAKRARLWECVLLFALLPIRVVEEANRDWRLLSWILALVVVGYTLSTLWRVGGHSWLKHFAFPVCFPLVAVPWLVQAENFIVQNLARGVASAAVEVAGWIGIGAYQLGNVIELPNGFVGVDDACSGVKTLQAAIMVTLFLGELQRLSPRNRLLLVMGGAAWVFLCNIFRATTLVIVAARQGMEAIAAWHDLIGVIVLIAGMAGLVGLAILLGKGSNVIQSAPHRPPVAGAPPNRQSVGETAAALIWLATIFGASELWYRAHEQNLIDRPAWNARWPSEEKSLRQMTIPDATRVILRYDEAASATWESPRGVKWWGFFARWKPERVALQLVRSHSPEICLPAIGRTFKRELPPLAFRQDALELGFRAYEFEQDDRPLFVFVAIQEDRTPRTASAVSPEWNTRGRLRAAWYGQRNLGQRLLEIAVIGFDDYFQAREATVKAVREIVD